MNIDVKLTKELIKTTDALRKKYKALKIGREAYETQIEETLKPLTKPLNELVKKSNIKQDQHNLINGPLKKIKLNFEHPQSQENDYDKKKHFHEEFTTPKTSIDDDDDSPIFSVDSNTTPKRTKNKSSHSSFAERLSQEQFHDTPKKYIDLFLNNSNTLDKTYGVHSKDGKMYIGNSELNIIGKDIEIKNKTFEGTNGLYELIFKKNPDKQVYTNEDLKNYRTILHDTNAHRIDHNSQRQVHGNRGYKYKKIISKLFGLRTNTSNTPSPSSSTLQIPSGSGIMQLSNLKKDYIFWDNPNELVDRLRLLIGSQQAGHNNHSNEIISIIEELKEANIIE